MVTVHKHISYPADRDAKISSSGSKVATEVSSHNCPDSVFWEDSIYVHGSL